MNSYKIPFYVKASLLSVGMLSFTGMLYISQTIIVPLIYSFILAIVLSPIVHFFIKKGMNKIIAISLTLLGAFMALALLIAILYSQLSHFTDTFPKLLDKFYVLLGQFQIWISNNFNISAVKVNSWAEETNTEILTDCRSLIGPTLVNIGSILVVLVLIPVYLIMILFYEPLLVEFIHRLFNVKKHIAVDEVLVATKRIIRSYLIGLLLEALIIAILNSTCLLILGIDYAILLGVFGAILNIIPYFGGILSVLLPTFIAIVTKSPSYSLLVIGSFALIQFADNHFIQPKVVASKVQINALFSIIVVLAGGAFWGIPGMFLSIPLTAILKVIFDHIDGLKPWGYLLGNQSSKLD